MIFFPDYTLIMTLHWEGHWDT